MVDNPIASFYCEYCGGKNCGGMLHLSTIDTGFWLFPFANEPTSASARHCKKKRLPASISVTILLKDWVRSGQRAAGGNFLP